MADSDLTRDVPITVHVVNLYMILILAKAYKDSKKLFYKYVEEKSNKTAKQEIHLWLRKPWLKTLRVS